MKTRIYLSVVLLLLVCGSFTVQSTPETHTTGLVSDQTTISLAGTTSIVTDIVQQIVGDIVSVDLIIPLGVDPHDFELTPSDISLINSSDHIFWIGGGAEESLENLLDTRSDAGTATSLLANLTNLIETEETHEGEEEGHDDHGLYDPHFWMDPLMVLQAVDIIESVLLELLPENSEAIQTQADSYRSELQNLHQDLVSIVKDLPVSKKFLVTQHNSFAYYARQYNFTTRTLQGISTDSETGIQEIDELANYLVENDIEVVFTESTTTSDNMEAVLESARAQGHGVAVGGQLFAGSLSSGEPASNYTGMLRYNTQTIVSNILNPPEVTESLLAPDYTWMFAILALPLFLRRSRQ